MLAPWKKNSDKPRKHIKKAETSLLLMMVSTVKVMVFSGVMYGCEIWTINKAEQQRIDAF